MTLLTNVPVSHPGKELLQELSKDPPAEIHTEAGESSAASLSVEEEVLQFGKRDGDGRQRIRFPLFFSF